MAWKREDDALKGIDPTSIETDVFCHIRLKHKFVIDIEHDAAVSFIHDMKKLLDKDFISRDLGPTEMRLREHYVRILGDVLTALSDDSGHEVSHIDFEITPVINVRCAYRDQHSLVKPIVQRLEDAAKNRVFDRQTERDERRKGQETHDSS